MRRHDQSSLFFRLLYRASAGLGSEAYSSRFTSGRNRLANSAFIGRATLRHRNQQARQWLAIPLSRGANTRRLGAFGMPKSLCSRVRQRRPDALPLSYRQTTISPFTPFSVDPKLPSLLATLDAHSFPSGHVMTLTSVLVPIVILWPATAILSVLSACCLAWARVATAHHFPSDVFAGAILGVGVGYPISLCLISLW